ncbi:hypothetical protein KVR01_012780 [Diaporthe batatas]|uniref:uncharacterized protein n=1 Tax=Diaporthe batatas TaxID=748121 RepID=UPI001D048FE8|nr:uncharacterized protein KVR01_012780 [Diaporthe batatas]KAG8157396.1 hypothetical protein KVR01_012780 [Diaporthe batatas]
MSSFFLLIPRSIDPRRHQRKDRDQSAPKWRLTDTVLPVHAIDNIPTLRGIVTSQALRFDDVLDGDLLYNSLTELLSMGDWKKFGGRFRLDDVPAVSYTHTTYPTTIDEATDAEIIQPRAGKARVIDIPDGVRRFLVGPHTPMSIDEYVKNDIPLISLHVINYADATLVVLTFPHALTDGMGWIGMIKNWCKVLAGAKNWDEIEVLGGLHEDALSRLDTDNVQDDEPFALDQKRLRGFRLFIFSIRSLTAWIFTPKIHHRGIFIPARLLAHVKQQTQREQEAMFKDHPEQKQFISNGDILSAWLIRLACSKMFRQSNRSVVIMGAIDLRSRLQKLLEPRTVYAQNLLSWSFTFVTLGDVLVAPLTRFASQIREGIKRQISESQIYAAVRRNLQSISATGTVPLYSDSDSILVVLSNLSRLNWHDVFDFKPAVVTKGPDRNLATAGLPVWQFGCSVSADSFATSILINGVDLDGNHWVEATLPGYVWDDIGNELAQWEDSESF